MEVTEEEVEVRELLMDMEGLILLLEAVAAMAILVTDTRGAATAAATEAHILLVRAESHTTEATEDLTAEKPTDTVATTTTEQGQMIETLATTLETDITTVEEERPMTVIMKMEEDPMFILGKGHEKRVLGETARIMAGVVFPGRRLQKESVLDLVLLVDKTL